LDFGEMERKSASLRLCQSRNIQYIIAPHFLRPAC
jgi:hypothetical protein